MNIYIDESGSINNHSEHEKHFVIALVRTIDRNKVLRTYKRFVSANIKQLKELDQAKIGSNGKILREGGKMFTQGNFKELKGAQFNREMKVRFVEYFAKSGGFEIYYIQLNNPKLTDALCNDIATAFNYPLKIALEYFINNKYLPKEELHLQLDERNEKTNKKYFLEQYLNTEFKARNVMTHEIDVTYFDSSQNKMIQVADVFANLFYSHLVTEQYGDQIDLLKRAGILKATFRFPLS